MNKKLVSLGVSLAMLANTLPGNLVEALAEEVTKTELEESASLVEAPVQEETLQEEVESIVAEEDTSEEKEAIIEESKEETKEESKEQIVDTTANEESKKEVVDTIDEKEIDDEELSVIAEDLIRTATVSTSIENGQYGNVEGLDEDNKVILKSKFTNVTSSSSGRFVVTTTYNGTYNQIDGEKKIVVKPKSGYEFEPLTLAALEGIDALTDFISVEKSGDIVTINVYPLKDEWKIVKTGSSVLSDSTNKSTKFDIRFTKKSNAKKVTTVVEGEGSIAPETPEDLVYENRAYTIGNQSKHTFRIEPKEGMEIKYVTLDDKYLQVVDGKVVVDGNEIDESSVLKAVFGEPAEVTYNLDVTVVGNGKVGIGTQSIEANSTKKIELNKGESYTLGFKPEENHYLSSVELDGVKVDDYKLENVDGDHTLVVTFEEKKETRIKFGDLKVPYDGNEKTLTYTVEDSDGKEVKTGNVEFKEKNWIGQWVTIKPTETGSYEFTVDYPGDDTHKPTSESGVFEIYDARKDVVIEFTNLSKVYNGTVQYPTAIAKDGETGEVIEGADVKIKYDFSLDITKTKGKDVGSYPFEATLEANDEYQGATVKDTFEVTKCTPKLTVGNKQVKYNGEPVSVPITVSPECGYITVYTGVNAKLSPKIYVDLNLGDDIVSQAIKKLLGNASLGNVGELVELLKNNQDFLATLGIDISQIVKVLDVLPLNIDLGFGCPNRPGGYVATAVVLDSNAKTTVGVGTLLITRQDKKVVFSEDSLADKSYIKYGADYKYEAYYEGTNSPAKIMYSGVTAKGELYFSDKKPTELGSYAAVAYSYDDLEYQVGLAARTFTIGKYLTNLEITSENKTYDGIGYEATSIVKDTHGNVIENAAVEYTYYKGLTKLDSAPKDVGRYFVVAKYNSTDEYFISMDSKLIEIKKADLTVIANDVEKYEGQVDPEFTYTAEDLCTGDTLDVKLTREVGEVVGEYNIIPTVDENPNYNLTIVNGKLTIKEMTYEVSVSAKDKVYDGESTEVEVEVVDVLNNKVENPEVTYTYYKEGEEKALDSAPVNAGKYVVVAEYKGFSARDEFEISKAQATITVNDAEKYVGEEDPEFTYDVEGLIGKENLEISLSREEGETAGEYAISATYVENSNYDVKINDGKLTISKKTIVPDPTPEPDQPEGGDGEGQNPDQGEDGDNEEGQNPDQGENGDNEEDEDLDQGEDGDNEEDEDLDQGEDGDSEEDQSPDQGEDKEENEDQNTNQGENNTDSDKGESVKTFDAGVAGYAGMGLLALGGLFISRRKKD